MHLSCRILPDIKCLLWHNPWHNLLQHKLEVAPALQLFCQWPSEDFFTYNTMIIVTFSGKSWGPIANRAVTYMAIPIPTAAYSNMLVKMKPQAVGIKGKALHKYTITVVIVLCFGLTPVTCMMPQPRASLQQQEALLQHEVAAAWRIVSYWVFTMLRLHTLDCIPDSRLLGTLWSQEFDNRPLWNPQLQWTHICL